MFYYNSKYLADKLDVNLAKWKRWTREFLPADPLGGLQSGYARQFNLKEAFRVHLGGRMVSALRFSIPETRSLLNELDPLLTEKGVYELSPQQMPPTPEDQWLFIYARPGRSFEYRIAKLAAPKPNSESHYGRMLNLSGIYRIFIERVVSNAQP